ncbi:MAG: hypothetical protein R3E88_05895 [Myxococcota bacterium]|nr:hypothetical protein [Myxococcales bacterium]
MGMSRAALAALVALAAGTASAYPGGTPSYQTDVAPFCAGCHSSVAESDLEGAGERAAKEVIAAKHLAPIAAGENGYKDLSEADRTTLVAHIRALDASSTIQMEFPPQVAVGETFNVTVNVTGGAGPVVGVALVDRAHRWYAKPATSAGWTVVGPPSVIGQDGRPQSEWSDARPEKFGRATTYVNVKGISSDASTESWGSAKVIFTLKAPDKPGDYPLVGVYLYGTEKGSPLGYTTNAVGWKMPRGTTAGASGRVRFTPEHEITVKPAEAAAAQGQ